MTPPNAVDCHVHVFGPADLYPYQRDRAYTPPDSTPDDLSALHAVLGIERAVIVQASVHGTDNSAVLDAVALAPDRRCGIASVGGGVSDTELERLAAGGIKGIRVNLVDKGGMPFASLDAVAEFSRRIEPLGWHVEFLVRVDESREFTDLAERLSVPAVVGHFGYAKITGGVRHPAYVRFLDMLKEGRCWTKLTGPYRITSLDTLPYEDVAPYAEALLDAAPNRLLWGSDWPHVMLRKPMPNDGDLLDLLKRWVPESEARKAVLVDNPARLYGAPFLPPKDQP